MSSSLNSIIDLGEDATPEHYQAALLACGKDNAADGVLAIYSPKPEDVVEMETRMSGQEIAFEADDDEDGYAPVHYLADADAEPSRQLEEAEATRLQASGLEQALSSLDERSRRIVEARWLREKDPATLQELAAEYKVSAERIRQIEAKALAKMRGVLKAGGLAALPSPAA